MNMVKDKWLSLSDVAAMVGVHPSTVRLWSNKGVIPVHRTQGGHRRYRRDEVELWLKASRQQNPVEPASVVQQALSRIRFQIGEGHLETETWYQKLDSDARSQYRLSGKVLLQGLANFLSSEGEEAIAEARSIGYEYASRGRRHGLSSLEAIRAFLFFRNLLLIDISKTYQEANLPGKAWQEMLSRLHAFTDQIMLSLLETYLAYESNQY